MIAHRLSAEVLHPAPRCARRAKLRRANCYATAHLVLNFRDPAPPSPRGVLANATPKRLPFRLITRNLSSGMWPSFFSSFSKSALNAASASTHRVKGFLHLGRQIICIDILPLQFFPCHALLQRKGTYPISRLPCLPFYRPGVRIATPWDPSNDDL